MDILIVNAITAILKERKDFLKIAVRQKNKFEGWLKFELAYYLEEAGMESVEVESTTEYKRDRYDISFFNLENYYRVELKTPNTNWNIEGIKKSTRPITNNINSIISDAKKLNSSQGIVAFVLFPIPVNDKRWEKYINRISEECQIEINKENNCKIVTVKVDSNNYCDLLVCAFKSRQFTNWY